MQLREKQKQSECLVFLKTIPSLCGSRRSLKINNRKSPPSTLRLRIDNTLYRAGFARTRMQARQFVSHGHLLVNGKKVDIPSFEVHVEMLFLFMRRCLIAHIFQILLPFKKFCPKWLQVDVKRKR